MHSKHVITHTWPANKWSANESPADGMASKHLRSSPTGLTLRQREKRQNRQGCIESASAKKLSFATTASWSAVEERALVDYGMGKGFVASWPRTKHTELWENAAKCLQERCKSAKRTSNCKFVFGGDE